MLDHIIPYVIFLFYVIAKETCLILENWKQ
jgi:hypothetical protein